MASSDRSKVYREALRVLALGVAQLLGSPPPPSLALVLALLVGVVAVGIGATAPTAALAGAQAHVDQVEAPIRVADLAADGRLHEAIVRMFGPAVEARVSARARPMVMRAGVEPARTEPSPGLGRARLPVPPPQCQPGGVDVGSLGPPSCYLALLQ